MWILELKGRCLVSSVAKAEINFFGFWLNVGKANLKALGSTRICSMRDLLQLLNSVTEVCYPLKNCQALWNSITSPVRRQNTWNYKKETTVNLTRFFLDLQILKVISFFFLLKKKTIGYKSLACITLQDCNMQRSRSRKNDAKKKRGGHRPLPDITRILSRLACSRGAPSVRWKPGTGQKISCRTVGNRWLTG